MKTAKKQEKEISPKSDKIKAYDIKPYKVKGYKVKAYKVLPYTSEELDKLERGEKVLTAEEMEENLMKQKSRK